MTFQLVHPVPDTNPLMSPGALGATSQPVVAADGDECGRVSAYGSKSSTRAFFGHGW